MKKMIYRISVFIILIIPLQFIDKLDAFKEHNYMLFLLLILYPLIYALIGVITALLRLKAYELLVNVPIMIYIFLKYYNTSAFLYLILYHGLTYLMFYLTENLIRLLDQLKEQKQSG